MADQPLFDALECEGTISCEPRFARGGLVLGLSEIETLVAQRLQWPRENRNHRIRVHGRHAPGRLLENGRRYCGRGMH